MAIYTLFPLIYQFYRLTKSRSGSNLKPPKHRRTNDVGLLNIEVTIGYCKSFVGRFLSHFVRAMELTGIFRISSRIGPSVNACYDFNDDIQQK